MFLLDGPEEANLGLAIIGLMIMLGAIVFIALFIIIRQFFYKQISGKIKPVALWLAVGSVSIIIGMLVLYIMGHGWGCEK